MNERQIPPQMLDDALDQALGRALAPPQLPQGFRDRLHSALAGHSPLDPVARRRALEKERSMNLARLRAEYIGIRRRTLGTLIGAAFATGAIVATAMPWISEAFGSLALLILPGVGILVGVSIGLSAWLRRSTLYR